MPGAQTALQATPGALIVDHSREKSKIAGDIGHCTREKRDQRSRVRWGTGMTLQARSGANAARSRTVPMLAALAPLLIFVGIDGVVHGITRSTFPQGKFISKGFTGNVSLFIIAS